MVLLNAGPRARAAASISNNTKIFGIMGGLAANHGIPSSVRTQYRYRSATKHLPTQPAAGLAYMKKNNLLSVNPQTSGGVGLRNLLFYR